MANEDSFITEVNEEVRRDKLYKLMRRYGPVAIALIVLLVGGAAYNEYRKSQVRADAQAAGDALIAAIAQEESTDRSDALAAIVAGEEDPGRRAVQSLIQAAALVDQGDRDAAREVLDGLAADNQVSKLYRDLATLKSAILASGKVSPDEIIASLQPLTVAGQPFRLMALEQQALAELANGNKDGALETLQGILADADATEDLKNRTSQLIVALGGAPTAQG